MELTHQLSFEHGRVDLEWKAHWGDKVQEWLADTPTDLDMVPADHFRIDVYVDDINPSRVRAAMAALTQSLCLAGRR